MNLGEYSRETRDGGPMKMDGVMQAVTGLYVLKPVVLGSEQERSRNQYFLGPSLLGPSPECGVRLLGTACRVL